MLKFKPVVSALVTSALLTGCATVPVTSKEGVVKVVYSMKYPDGSIQKELPAEVTIVKREATQGVVAGQVALNIFMLALGGGVGVQGFSKDALKGSTIRELERREHIQNPVPGRFLGELEEKVNAAIQADEALREKRFTKPLRVAGGNARLIYETLLGEDDQRFRLKTDLLVYKTKENANLWSGPYVVNCQDASPEPFIQAQWAEQDYLLVKTQLDAMLATCEKKVLAELLGMLSE